MNDWSPARVKSFIISVLRSGTRRWPPKYLCLAEAYTEKKINPKTGRLAKHFLCNICKEEFTSTNIQVDHIIPVAAIDGFTTWDDFINKLFCGKENLQAVCKQCHNIKSQAEKKQRKK